MSQHDREAAAEAFEEQRTHLRAIGYRMLGSVHEADDAVQETWLRLDRLEADERAGIENLAAWLTTVMSRICLDALRSRTARREDLGDEPPAEAQATSGSARSADPAELAEQADAVGTALLVVLETLAPAERLAFVLHDLFGVSFDEISTALGRSPAACRQLASRARRRVRGQGEQVAADRARQREIVAAFLDAARNGNFDALLSMLHPDARITSDAVAAAMGSPARIDGQLEVARFFNGSAKAAKLCELDGFAAAQWSHRGELKVVFGFTVEDGLVREIEFLAGDVALLDVNRRPGSAARG